MSILKRSDARHLADLTPEERAEIEGAVQAIFQRRDVCPGCAASLLIDLAGRISASWALFTGSEGSRDKLH